MDPAFWGAVLGALMTMAPATALTLRIERKKRQQRQAEAVAEFISSCTASEGKWFIDDCSRIWNLDGIPFERAVQENPDVLIGVFQARTAFYKDILTDLEVLQFKILSEQVQQRIEELKAYIEGDKKNYFAAANSLFPSGNATGAVISIAPSGDTELETFLSPPFTEEYHRLMKELKGIAKQQFVK